MSETTSNETDKDKPRRRGAQPKNRSAMRHGLTGNKVPKGAEFIENRVNGLRRQIEDQVMQLRGEINIVDAARINSILKWERHGQLAAHWLRKEAENLSPADRLKFSEAIAKASDRRDKNIEALGLNIEPEPINLNTYLTTKGDEDES
ncbi:MAG: hypothetical protein KDA93_24685 [Planctomycetaceae bacterium]|nr:hypothetical protein [Planctomycetaceae bacterium]